MKWLVFSRNRPFQLDSFLRSASENAEIDKRDISVLHRYDAEYSESLDILKSEHPDCSYIDESNFREQTIEWVNSASDIISFATDDAIFTRKIRSDLAREVLLQNPAILTISLRLGLHLDWCYPTNSKQSVPNGQIISQLFAWDSKTAEGDWGYPLSVDGHIYRKQEILEMLKRLEYKNPNTLEACMQHMLPFVQNISCCFMKSSYFNSPLNMVQTVYMNRAGQVTVEELDRAYRSGKRLNPSLLENFCNHSAHQEVNLLELCK